jgi:hypothetical protein
MLILRKLYIETCPLQSPMTIIDYTVEYISITNGLVAHLSMSPGYVHIVINGCSTSSSIKRGKCVMSIISVRL